MLSTEQLQQFKCLYKNRFGEDLSQENALEHSTKLLTIVKLVYQPISKIDLQSLASGGG